MGFTLKIYFLGLVALAVRPDGTQVTALMVDARHDYYLSDGCPIGEHVPLLVTNAASCEGPDCRTDSQQAFDALFGDDKDHTRLGGAMCGGNVWVLDNADLSIAATRGGSPAKPLKIFRVGEKDRTPGRGAMPSKQEDRAGFDWVADLGQILSGGASLDPDAVSKGLVAARFKLDTGTLGSCKLVSTDGEKVSPLAFSTLAELHNSVEGGWSDEPKTQGPIGAFSDWLVAEIEIPDCSVTIEDRDFDGNIRRAVKLSPSQCDGSGVVEAALINLPTGSFADPDKKPYVQPNRCDDSLGAKGEDRNKRKVGQHFEIFYELTECRPPARTRPVPYVTESALRDLSTIPATPPGQVGSKLLRALLPANLTRGGYSRPICPVATLQDRQR